MVGSLATQPSEAETLVKQVGSIGTEYLKGVKEEGIKQAMDYEKENAQQQIDDAKTTVKGWWAQYCGYFGSA
ncbi:hypothetical protein BD779DRAFT_1669917 [Infundibulicybe gibba]|nr:hypothetical protein BD779DRAFT_1669917 [Infundibulicybe gibba]